jgi:hypothetical protein
MGSYQRRWCSEISSEGKNERKGTDDEPLDKVRQHVQAVFYKSSLITLGQKVFEKI